MFSEAQIPSRSLPVPGGRNRGTFRVHNKIRALIKPAVKGKSPKVTRNLADERLKVFAVCKTWRREVLRCGADAGSGEGAGAAQVAVASAQRQVSGRGLCPRAGCVRTGAVGRQGLWKVPGAAPSLSFALGGPRRRQRPGLTGDLLREAAIPRSPHGLCCQLFACLSGWNSFKLKQWNEAQVPKCRVPLLHQHSSEESN